MNKAFSVCALTPAGRLILIQRVTSGLPVAHVAKERGISLPAACQWANQHQDEGLLGLKTVPPSPNLPTCHEPAENRRSYLNPY
ncbi:hypothetical protein LJ751_11260 [Arthrobacter sp. zg-Y809]|uniref:Uncharacterized protein n=1 Tax=Arthrobacter gengyunqii TaxID=2886940 RepID=A0A9X1M237_9MICC|nr:hypothetical protein [Arthrobacter gengyunqii]